MYFFILNAFSVKNENWETKKKNNFMKFIKVF